MNHLTRAMKRLICMLLSVVMLLCLGACGRDENYTSGTVAPAVPTEKLAPMPTHAAEIDSTAVPAIPTEDRTDPSLVIFRQAMVETPQLFAAAFFGYVPQGGDPFALMQETAPQLCEDLPFLLAIDQNHILGVEGQLFCIVPADENATVAVNRRPWNAETESYDEPEILYRSEIGSPILVMCPNENWIPDTEIVITDSRGIVTTWSPYLDPSYRIASMLDDNGDSLIFDFTSYDELPLSDRNHEINSSKLVGTWELAWTEVEGDRNPAAPGVCMIEITTDESGSFRFTYSERDFTDWNVRDRELLVSPGELYPGCGNDQWVGTVSDTSADEARYALTLLEDGTLLLQTYWEMDGIPMVSTGWYERIG